MIWRRGSSLKGFSIETVLSVAWIFCEELAVLNDWGLMGKVFGIPILLHCFARRIRWVCLWLCSQSNGTERCYQMSTHPQPRVAADLLLISTRDFWKTRARDHHLYQKDPSVNIINPTRIQVHVALWGTRVRLFRNVLKTYVVVTSRLLLYKHVIICVQESSAIRRHLG